MSSRALVDAQEEGQEGPQCCLCPVSGGALKRTTEPGLWCHAACMQWIPEVTVEDLNRMEPVSHIKSIQKERWDLNCSVCRQSLSPAAERATVFEITINLFAYATVSVLC